MSRFSFNSTLFALFVATLAGRAATTATWDGATANWTDAAHWSTAPLFPNNSNPNFYDAVINGGSATLNQNITINRLTLGGGAIDGAFALTANEGLQWTSGAIRGAGSLILGNAVPTTIAGGASVLVLRSRTINNTGAATFSAGTIRGGFGAVLNNSAGASFTVLGQANFFADTSSPAYTINNAGTFVARSVSGAGFTTIDATFNNSGSVSVENLGASHTLSLAGGGAQSGAFVLQAGTALEFGGSTTLQAGASVSGPGTAFIAGAVNVAANFSAQKLAIAVGELNVANRLVTVSASATQTGGTLRLGSGGTFRVTGGTLFVDGGTLTGAGTLEAALDTFGRIEPGAALGTLAITGAVTLRAGAQLAIELGGTTAGSFDVLGITGPATLGGQLAVSMVNNFIPAPGATFTILTATGGVSSGFANAPIEGARFQTADGRGSFAIHFTPTSVALGQFIPNPPSGLGRIDRESGGGYRVTFTGTPGMTYTIQFTATLAPPSWQTLGTAAADSQGVYSFLNTPPAGTSQRFYRSILP